MDHEIGLICIAAEKSVKLTHVQESYHVKEKDPNKLLQKWTVFFNGNSKHYSNTLLSDTQGTVTETLKYNCYSLQGAFHHSQSDDCYQPFSCVFFFFFFRFNLIFNMILYISVIQINLPWIPVISYCDFFTK